MGGVTPPYVVHDFAMHAQLQVPEHRRQAREAAERGRRDGREEPGERAPCPHVRVLARVRRGRMALRPGDQEPVVEARQLLPRRLVSLAHGAPEELETLGLFRRRDAGLVRADLRRVRVEVVRHGDVERERVRCAGHLVPPPNWLSVSGARRAGAGDRLYGTPPEGSMVFILPAGRRNDHVQPTHLPTQFEWYRSAGVRLRRGCGAPVAS